MNKIQELTNQEYNKQRDTLNLIASENYPSKEVIELLGTVWSNKYGEGYPGKRYYAGNQYTDELESYCQELALKTFDKTLEQEYRVNVQILSGSPANMMVYLSFLEYDDMVMSININNGGHISHMHATSNWQKFFRYANYDVKEIASDTYEVDIEDYKAKLLEHKPKLVIIGFSAYPRKYEFEEMIVAAHEAGALVLADVAHINGLIATGLHDTPFKEGAKGADFVSMTTHKTFRGPRAGMLFAKKEHIKTINKTVFPGTSGGPHFNKIAAIARALEEIQGIEKHPDGRNFQDYSQAVLDNCKALENSLAANGLKVISPTENHLCLIQFPDDLDSLEMQQKLERAGIITNRNGVPFDKKTAWRPSGMRLGSAALTSRGMDQKGFQKLGKIIADLVFDKISEEEALKEATLIAKDLNWWY